LATSRASARKSRSKPSLLEAQAGNTRYLLIGDAEHTRRLNEQLGLKLPLQPYAGKDDPGRFFLCQPLPDPLPADLLEGSPAAARAAVAWVRDGAERCLRGQLDALVTAPVNKEAIVRPGRPSSGKPNSFHNSPAPTARR
jgi:4-hydroxy-L-threonine phosphate dehydrogenase PdxA